MYRPLKDRNFLIALTLLLIVFLAQFLMAQDKKQKEAQYASTPDAVFWEVPDSLGGVTITEPTTKEEVVLPVKKVLFEYIEIKNSCGVHYQGDCVNVRSGPGTDFPVVYQLRNNVVLKVSGKVEWGGHAWFKVEFDEWLRYPERVKGDWYVAAEYADVVFDEGDRNIWDHEFFPTTKRIVISREKQLLTAYEDGTVFMETPISTGLELTPTPRGTFTVFKKTPTRYMQGPIPGIANQYYDMPGVPWNLYFSHDGAVIHGAYWHDSFGSQYSHGCVNLPPDKAKKLYQWADLNTEVVVED